MERPIVRPLPNRHIPIKIEIRLIILAKIDAIQATNFELLKYWIVILQATVRARAELVQNPGTLLYGD